MHEEGFSLIELMVVVFVAAIGLGLGVPAFSAMIANNRMTGAVNDMVTSLNAARSEAIKRRTTVTLCPAPADRGGATCDLADSLANGWIVLADPNGNGAVDAGEEILQSHGPLPAEIGSRFTVGIGTPAQYVAFSGSGFTRVLPAIGDPITAMEFCDGRGDVDTGGGIAAGRWISIDPTGRPQIHRLRTQVQTGPLGGC